MDIISVDRSIANGIDFTESIDVYGKWERWNCNWKITHRFVFLILISALVLFMYRRIESRFYGDPLSQSYLWTRPKTKSNQLTCQGFFFSSLCNVWESLCYFFSRWAVIGLIVVVAIDALATVSFRRYFSCICARYFPYRRSVWFVPIVRYNVFIASSCFTAPHVYLHIPSMCIYAFKQNYGSKP